MKNLSENSIYLTSTALSAAADLQKREVGYGGKDLRLYLEGKGCDGFYYGVTFDSATEQDLRFSQSIGDKTITVIVDPETMTFVEGSTIDWVDDERGRGFLVDNPNQKAFRGKFFKREAWKQRLSSTKQGAPN